jgi:NAD(P)-dependent dehydrogenase (short-subunit alcohol dehydrogenase family)
MANQRIALVTGASRGLGLEMCRQLAARGVTVLLSARGLASADEAAAMVRADGGDCRPLALDVTDAEQIAAVAAELDSSCGRLDVLVNNAAILTDLGVQPSATDEAVLRANLDVNFVGPYMLIAALTPLLRRSGTARVLNLGTQVGSFGNLDDTGSPLVDDICPAYQASKTTLNATTALFAKELRPDGITVNSVCPGWVMTDMGNYDLPDYGDAVAPMSPTEAVAQMLWLVENEPIPPTGRFWSQGEEIPW